MLLAKNDLFLFSCFLVFFSLPSGKTKEKLRDLKLAGLLRVESFVEAKWEIFRVMEVDSSPRFKLSGPCRVFFEGIPQYQDETKKYEALTRSPILSSTLLSDVLGRGEDVGSAMLHFKGKLSFQNAVRRVKSANIMTRRHSNDFSENTVMSPEHEEEMTVSKSSVPKSTGPSAIITSTISNRHPRNVVIRIG
jgi:hypothetical protein